MSHAKYGPSKIGPLMSCVRFEYRQTEAKADAADEGKLLHKAVELDDYTGLTPEQKRVAQHARHYGDNLRDSFGPGTTDELEQEVQLEGLTFGTPDRQIIAPDDSVLITIDNKFVRNASADYKMQLKIYGAAKYEMARRRGRKIKRLESHVIAPRIDLLPEIIVYEDAEKAYNEIRDEITALYERIADPFTPPTPTPELCDHCARAAKCPALNKLMHTALAEQRIPLPTTFDPMAPRTPVQKSIVRTMATIAENWASLIKDSQKADAQNGLLLPGYRIMSKSNGLRIPKENTMEAFKRLRKMFPEDTIIGTMTLSIGALAAAAAELSQESVDDIEVEIVKVLRGLTEEEILTQSIEHPEKADELKHQGDLTTETRSTYYQKAKSGKGNEAELLQDLLEQEAVENAKKITEEATIE